MYLEPRIKNQGADSFLRMQSIYRIVMWEYLTVLAIQIYNVEPENEGNIICSLCFVIWNLLFKKNWLKCPYKY
jgi:hypothetical protein